MDRILLGFTSRQAPQPNLPIHNACGYRQQVLVVTKLSVISVLASFQDRRAEVASFESASGFIWVGIYSVARVLDHDQKAGCVEQPRHY